MVRKSREVYHPKLGKRIKVYSLAEELQFHASLDPTCLTADFIARMNQEWEIVLTDGQKEFLNNREEMKTFLKDNQGKFVHVVYKYCEEYFEQLDYLDLVRLCVLACYASSSGKCYDENNNEIKRGSLSKIWDVHSSNVKQSYDRLLELGLISLTERGQIMINTEIFKNGKIQVEKGQTYIRMFNKGLLDLYYNTPKLKRKQIGMFIKLLPYINYKYNILCFNPEETNKDNIKPLSWENICDILGQDAEATHTRTKNAVMRLSSNDIPIVGQFQVKKGYHLVVNPRVYYAGNDVADVKHLYVMFGMPTTGDVNYKR